jgi:hypothetical protein
MVRSDLARRLGVLSTVALMTAGLGACGGGKKATASQKLDAPFAHRVDGVCARTLAQYQANGRFPYPQFDPVHPDPKLLPRVGAFLARNQPAAQATPGEMRALGEPAQARAQWDRVRTLITQAMASSARQVAFAKSSNAAGFAAETRTANRLHETLTADGKALGFSSSSPCAMVF